MNSEEFEQLRYEKDRELQRYFAKIDLLSGALIGSFITACIVAFARFFN